MNVIITGASRGIGLETAKILAKEHTVINISRSASKNRQSGILPIDFDLETGNVAEVLIPEIQNVLKQAGSNSSKIDVLINNAATLLKKPFVQLTDADFEKIYKVNVFGIARLTRHILPLMKTGHVVNISSIGGVQGSVKFPGLSAYSSSKGALITLTECLAEEFKGSGIAFNAVAFGSVQTEMLTQAFPNFKAPVTSAEAGAFLADFALNGHKLFNGKIIQASLSTP